MFSPAVHDPNVGSRQNRTLEVFQSGATRLSRSLSFPTRSPQVNSLQPLLSFSVSSRPRPMPDPTPSEGGIAAVSAKRGAEGT